MRPQEQKNNLIDRICDACLTVSGWLCLALVILTTEQVVARYFFNAASIGLQELEWHLFGGIFLLAAAPALLRGEHVRVDIFYSRMTKRQQRRIDRAGHLLFLLPTAAVLIWWGITATIQARSFSMGVTEYGRLFTLIFGGESSPDPGGLPGRWIIKSLIPICGLLLALAGLRLIFLKSPKGPEGEP